MALFVLFLVVVISAFVKSTKVPVDVFGIYLIENFEVTKK